VTAAQRLALEERRRTRRMLEDALGGLGIAMAVVDRDLRVTAWSSRAAELWGPGLDAVCDRPLAHLEIGLPIGEIHDAARACIDERACPEERRSDATDCWGRRVVARVVCLPLKDAAGHIQAAAIVIDTL
jgi:PAS domain-containing protein